MNICIRCNSKFNGRFPKSKICKSCSKRGMPRGTGHWNYKNGSYTYETIRNAIKDTVRYCERCDKDLIDSTRYEWVIHHKDHNHYNNEKYNLELLCKSCHQIEHKVYRNFEGATTISKESRNKCSEAPSSVKTDDDIVCSYE